jgi:hypothetical protein
VKTKLGFLLWGLLVPETAFAASLKDMLEKPAQATFSSSKSALAIEHCVGVGIGDWLTPITIRGEDVVELFGSPTVNFSNVIYMVVTIRTSGKTQEVSFRSHKGWDDKTAVLIRSCI